MNTLNRDRNTLKRLVESYGKKDVLNYVRHLNESITPSVSSIQLFNLYDKYMADADNAALDKIYNILDPIQDELSAAFGHSVSFNVDEGANDGDSRKYFYAGEISEPYNMQYYDNDDLEILPGIAIDSKGNLFGWVLISEDYGDEMSDYIVKYNSAQEFANGINTMLSKHITDPYQVFNVIETL